MDIFETPKKRPPFLWLVPRDPAAFPQAREALLGNHAPLLPRLRVPLLDRVIFRQKTKLILVP